VLLARLVCIQSILIWVGIPFDMDSGFAFKDADYRSQTAAMNANLSALEATLLNFTLWNYVAENCHAWGDGWYVFIV
jgi:hypothetical protein